MWITSADSATPRRRRLALRAALLCGCASRAPDEHPAQSQRAAPPNIVLILTDDQAPRTLAIEGNAHIRTPHLDRLAREGVYFSRAYVPLPQCAPSRAALLTGRYPHELDAITNRDAALR